MKAREVIRQIEEAADGDLDMEVCVGNVDIHFIACEPAWYDGPMEVLWRDQNQPGYNIVGAEMRHEGSKLQIHTHAIEDMLLDDPEMPVDVSHPWDVERVDRIREEYRQLYE